MAKIFFIFKILTWFYLFIYLFMSGNLFGLGLRNETEEKLKKKKERREKANRKINHISKSLSQTS